MKKTEIKNIMDALMIHNTNNPLSGKQGLSITTPCAGQLHRFPNAKKNPELFLLVTEVNSDKCETIPGTLNAVMAGPEDILLPPSIFGQVIALSLDLSCTLPVSKLGEGFAILNRSEFNRVIDSQIKYETGVDGEKPSYPFALPFVSKHDSRIMYHKKMESALIEAQSEMVSDLFEEEDQPNETIQLHTLFSFTQTNEFRLAAGDAEQNPIVRFVCPDMNAEGEIEISRSENKLFICMLDENKEETYAFSGWDFIDPDGISLGKIQDEKAVLPFDALSRIAGLRDLNGQIHSLDNIK